MRCNNCGYDNAPEQTHCEKCNSILKSSFVDSEPNNRQTDGGISGTIKGKQIETDPWDCPQCGRPVVPGSEICNSCNYVFGQSDNKNAQQGYKNRGGNLSGTIDPYQKGFKLKPVATNYENELDEIKFKASEENVKLGRENLEATNATISKEQAELEYRNGKWYIKNLSDKKSSFVLATEYIELDDGDVLLLGDRKFIFSK